MLALATPLLATAFADKYLCFALPDEKTATEHTGNRQPGSDFNKSLKQTGGQTLGHVSGPC